MKETCDPNAIKDQVKRTEGQVLGIGRMIEANRDCTDVLQQIVAARASLQKLATVLLEAEAEGCFGGTGDQAAKVKDLEKIVSNLFKVT
jgi:CsoR family transcriptional regulator, copper-sensing transcriptional repressor